MTIYTENETGLGDFLQQPQQCAHCHRPALEFDTVCRGCGQAISPDFSAEIFLRQLTELGSPDLSIAQVLHPYFSEFRPLEDFLRAKTMTAYWHQLDAEIDTLKTTIARHRHLLTQGDLDLIQKAMQKFIQQIFHGIARPSPNNPFQTLIAEYTQHYLRVPESQAKESLAAAEKALAAIAKGYNCYEAAVRGITIQYNQFTDMSALPTERPSIIDWRRQVEYRSLLQLLDPSLLFGFCPALLVKIRSNQNSLKSRKTKGGQRR